MKSVCSFSRFVVLLIACALASALSAANPVAPDERDRQVLQTLLLHLLAHPEFDMTNVPAQGATIILHRRTPEKTGMLQSNQIRADLGGRKKLPAGIEQALRRRNSRSTGFDSVEASFAELKFAAGIVVTDLTGNRGFVGSARAFEKAHPKARGWVEAYLPGYSNDGAQAVVRAWIGPTPHGASVIALLKKRGEKWVVLWHEIALYA